MNYWETLRVILRRWKLSVPTFLVAIGLGVGAFFAVPPTYQDQVQLLFLVTATTDKDGPVNPYLDFGGTLVSTADVMRVSVTTMQSANQLAEQGDTADYDVVLDTSTSAPVLIVTTQSSKPAIARQTVHGVVDLINQQLTEKQTEAGAARSTWVRTSIISSLDKPEKQLKKPLQFGIGAMAGFEVVVLFVLFLLERRRALASPRSIRHRRNGDGEPVLEGAAETEASAPSTDPAQVSATPEEPAHSPFTGPWGLVLDPRRWEAEARQENDHGGNAAETESGADPFAGRPAPIAPIAVPETLERPSAERPVRVGKQDEGPGGQPVPSAPVPSAPAPVEAVPFARPMPETSAVSSLFAPVTNPQAWRSPADPGADQLIPPGLQRGRVFEGGLRLPRTFPGDGAFAGDGGRETPDGNRAEPVPPALPVRGGAANGAQAQPVPAAAGSANGTPAAARGAVKAANGVLRGVDEPGREEPSSEGPGHGESPWKR